MNKWKKYMAVARVNFTHASWIAYLVAGVCILAMIGDLIVDRAMGLTDIFAISPYSMLYIVALLAPILIATANYGKLMNIGLKKKTFFWACLINYSVFALVISLLGTLAYYLVDAPLNRSGYSFYGIINIFGWDSSVLDTFFSQLAFLLLLQVTIHTLAFMQAKWYGWVADVLIAAIISVFTPIPVLRAAEVFFFDLLLFSRPAIIHIAISLGLAALFYASNLLYLKHRDSV